MLLVGRRCSARPAGVRTFLTNQSHYKWSSPVKLYGRKRIPFAPVPLPPNVTTLDPHKLTPDHYFDISQSPWSKHYRTIQTSLNVHPQMRQFGDIVYTKDAVFPPDTRGFFYYHSPSNQNPLGASVRFRLASEPTIDAFRSGTDLLMPYGVVPWGIPAWEVVTTRGYENLFRLLIQDKFAPPNMQLACQSLGIVRDSVLYTGLGQPYITDLAFEHSRLYLVHPGMHPVPFMVHHPWFNRSVSGHSPVKGRAVLSIVQRPDSTFGLRIDKVLQLAYRGTVNGTVLPEEGQVTPLQLRAVVRSTKIKEAKLQKLWTMLLGPLGRLPWVDFKQDPFDVFRHGETPLPERKRRAESTETGSWEKRQRAPHLEQLGN